MPYFCLGSVGLVRDFASRNMFYFIQTGFIEKGTFGFFSVLLQLQATTSFYFLVNFVSLVARSYFDAKFYF